MQQKQEKEGWWRNESLKMMSLKMKEILLAEEEVYNHTLCVFPPGHT